MGFCLIYGAQIEVPYKFDSKYEHFIEEFIKKFPRYKFKDTDSRWNQESESYLCMYLSENGCELNGLEILNQCNMDEFINNFETFCDDYSKMFNIKHMPYIIHMGLFNVHNGDIN